MFGFACILLYIKFAALFIWHLFVFRFALRFRSLMVLLVWVLFYCLELVELHAWVFDLRCAIHYLFLVVLFGSVGFRFWFLCRFGCGLY